MISLSLLSTAHHPHFQLWCVRSSRQCYPPFNLAMDRSLRFRVYRARLNALLRLAFAPAPPDGLTLPHTVTRRPIMQKVRDRTALRRGAFTACRRTVLGSISLPSPGFFSPFPRGTCSLSVSEEYLALEGGPSRFPPDCTCPAVLRYRVGLLQFSTTGLSPAMARRPKRFV